MPPLARAALILAVSVCCWAAPAASFSHCECSSLTEAAKLGYLSCDTSLVDGRPLSGDRFVCTGERLLAPGFGLRGIDGRLFRRMYPGDKIVWLDLSGNALTALVEPHLVDLTGLLRLELQRNRLSRLSYQFFEGVVHLKYLDLEANHLEEITARTFGTATVSSHSNACSLQSLYYLYLGGNRIRSVQPGSFECMRQLRRLNLRNNELKVLPNRAFSSLLSLRQLRLYANRIETIEEFAFESCCGELEYLSLVDNRIDHLSPRLFRGMANLTSLYLDRNRFVRVPGGMLALMHTMGPAKLADLHFQRNHLVRIRVGDFNGANRIESLNLFDNSIQEIDDYSFAKLTRTKNLVLQKNELKRVGNRTFAGMSRLKYLVLNDNRIQRIDDASFAGLSRLDTLSLAGNRLSRLRKRMFLGLNYTFSLNLAANDIDDLSGNEFEYLHGLKYLYLEKNRLRRLREPDLRGLRDLKKLDLSDNRIHSVDSLAFRDLQQLLFLDLSGNRLTTLCVHILYGLSSLHSLLVGKNLVEDFDPHSLTQLTSLQLLDLSDNRLRHFAVGWHDDSGGRPRLRFLDLSGNRLLLTDCSFCSLQSLQSLHLSLPGANRSSVGRLLRGLGGSSSLELTLNDVRLSGAELRAMRIESCPPATEQFCRSRYANQLAAMRTRACFSGAGSAPTASGSSEQLQHLLLYVSLPALLLLLLLAAAGAAFFVACRRSSRRRRQFAQRRIFEPETNLLELNVENSSTSSEMPKFTNKIYGNLL